MYILEMMKKDPKSVIGLTVGVEINGVHNAVIGVVKDAEVKNYSWAISEEGNHINMGADESMLEKLTVLGPGEVVCDDYRTFKE